MPHEEVHSVTLEEGADLTGHEYMEFVYGSERWQIPEEVLAEEAVYRQSLLDQNITCMDVNDTVPFGLLVNGTGCPADSPLMMYALYLAIVLLVLSLAAYARRGTSGAACSTAAALGRAARGGGASPSPSRGVSGALAGPLRRSTGAHRGAVEVCRVSYVKPFDLCIRPTQLPWTGYACERMETVQTSVGDTR